MFYKDKAPVSQEAWQEMEEEIKNVFMNYLSARRVFHVEGPFGFDYNVITDGRLEEACEEDGVGYSTYRVQPLTEARVEFKMSRWELDNILRGAKDIDYDALDEASKKIALFEESAIFHGLKEGKIDGILENSGHRLNFGNSPEEIMEGISEAIIRLKENYAEGPYTLIVGEDAYKSIISKETSYPLDKRIEDLIGGSIVYNHVIDGAILVPFNHDDLELTIGQDLSLGYQYHDNKEVTFFLMESFTFRILDENIIVRFDL